jgi:lipoprotein-anchoring transpeptidase ErfK/SrfK
VHRAAQTAVLVVAATAALVAAGPASAQISTITAINRARESTAAAHAPQAPGIARVTGSYDTAGVLSIDVAFRHPLTALQASHQYAWTVLLSLGTAVSATDPRAGCRTTLAAEIGIADGLASTVTTTGAPAIPVSASVSASGARIAVGSPAIAGRSVACLTALMVGRVHASATAPGARIDANCGCTYVATVTDRLRDGSGDPVAWFDGLRPAPQGPPIAGPTGRVAWIATVVVPTTARRRPGAGGAPIAHVAAASTVDGGPQALLVLAARRDAAGALWLDVRLPIRPNTANGWIPADDATLATTPWRIVVSLRARTLTILRAGHRIARIRVVIGKPATPTPRGLFAVAAIVRQVNPNGFLGPYALHLTAHSNVLDNFGGGPGRVAIHGRGGASLRDPLGSARSHGCVRITSSWVAYLAARVPRGTPVLVG